ncbi:DUF3365 domain-containing protein [Seongchinamella sediminis]|uniref:DUF3365 domain-containing protein n=1 Tax=Seongchinamella sediminis TaxID=2283635 RepID=A0A3L7E2L9_9GAMM|nr:DUF3365 domain-containing protein [Seongchinamella sediminis]RLQ22462.1 DUF3365 domain-containing protein [Seongchinamella sediminis]
MVRLALFFVLQALLATWAHADRQAELRQEATALAAEFVGQLKPQLQQAMTEGGPVRAIEVCADIAPDIADSLSASSGWQVRRVSLRQRNASRAVPDAWERQILEQFDQRQAAGEPAAELFSDALQPAHYRYMRAQVTAPLCLACHGESLSGEVTAALEQYYPDDSARGYQLGQVRGAISLTRPLQDDCGPEIEC